MSEKDAQNCYHFATPANWLSTTLGDVCSRGNGLIQTGPFGSQLHAHDYSEEGTPVVMPQQLGDNQINPEGIARVSDVHVERLSRHRLRRGDIVYSRRGDVTRRALITAESDGWLCGTGCLLIRVEHPDVDNQYLSFFFSLPTVKEYITKQAVGATMPNLNTKIMCDIPLFLPRILEQRKAVAILTAYDDLIANNTRRIAVLEEMAQSLYREWFVRFRFPGHEQARFIDTEQGRVPEGWEIKQLVALQSSIPNAINGGPFGSKLGTKDYTPAGVPVIRGGNLSEEGRFSDEEFVFVSEEKADELKPNTAMPGDIVVTQRGTLGQIGMIPHHTGHRRFIISQSQMKITLDPAKVNVLYAFYALKSQEANARIKNLAISSGVPHINLGTLREFTINCPPGIIQEMFGAFVSPVEEQITLLTRKCRCLRRTRDLLLPKLISGELDVERLDIDTGDPVIEVTT